MDRLNSALAATVERRNQGIVTRQAAVMACPPSDALAPVFPRVLAARRVIGRVGAKAQETLETCAEFITVFGICKVQATGH